MRRDVLDLRDFYAAPLGAAARRMLSRRLVEAWGTGRGLDILGLGYATPWLDDLSEARRVVAAMPGGQGGERWPATGTLGRNSSCLVEDGRLPFTAALFDRILCVHALEEADDPRRVLAETGRVLSASGRIIIAVAARGGLWTRAEHTPFGHGRAFTRGQLERLVREAGLEPTAWSRALYLPPWPPLARLADPIEQVGAALLPTGAGLILMEAMKQAYALSRPGLAAPVTVGAGRLAPQPATRVGAPLSSRRERR